MQRNHDSQVVVLNTAVFQELLTRAKRADDFDYDSNVTLESIEKHAGKWNPHLFVEEREKYAQTRELRRQNKLRCYHLNNHYAGTDKVVYVAVAPNLFGPNQYTFYLPCRIKGRSKIGGFARHLWDQILCNPKCKATFSKDTLRVETIDQVTTRGRNFNCQVSFIIEELPEGAQFIENGPLAHHYYVPHPVIA